MGILRGREEFIPVTCAVLKDADRDVFFGQIRRNRAGTPEELARWLDVSVSLVQDWITGKRHIPFHTLQNIAYQFSVELPPITELRRESVPATQLPSAKPAEPAPPPAPRRAKSEGRRAERAPEPRSQHRKGNRPAAQHKPKEHRAAEPKPNPPPAPRAEEQKKQGTKSPKLSDALAYWVGVLYAGVRVEGDRLILSADRRIGQNFAAAWARRTKELFGVHQELTAAEGGKVQQASCEIAGFAEFRARTCPGAGSQAEEVSLPRWIWSNPAWKTACLRGLGDVSARFTRQPSLSFGLAAGLARSLSKLLSSVGFKAQTDRDGALMIAGKEEIERYFELVGTENLKLRDQWTAYGRNEGEPEDAAEGGETPTQTIPTSPTESAPPLSSPETPIEPPSEHPAPAHAPGSRRRSHRPKRTVYRGKPGQ